MQECVIKPKDIMAYPEKVFFVGEGLVKVFIKTDKMFMGQFELLPGQKLDVDIHPEGDEGYFIVEGVCTVVIETDKIFEIHKGEVFFIPRNVKHQAMNQCNEKLRVIFCIAPKPN